MIRAPNLPAVVGFFEANAEGNGPDPNKLVGSGILLTPGWVASAGHVFRAFYEAGSHRALWCQVGNQPARVDGLTINYHPRRQDIAVARLVDPILGQTSRVLMPGRIPQRGSLLGWVKQVGASGTSLGARLETIPGTLEADCHEGDSEHDSFTLLGTRRFVLGSSHWLADLGISGGPILDRQGSCRGLVSTGVRHNASSRNFFGGPFKWVLVVPASEFPSIHEDRVEWPAAPLVEARLPDLARADTSQLHVELDQRYEALLQEAESNALLKDISTWGETMHRVIDELIDAQAFRLESIRGDQSIDQSAESIEPAYDERLVPAWPSALNLSALGIVIRFLRGAGWLAERSGLHAIPIQAGGLPSSLQDAVAGAIESLLARAFDVTASQLQRATATVQRSPESNQDGDRPVLPYGATAPIRRNGSRMLGVFRTRWLRSRLAGRFRFLDLRSWTLLVLDMLRPEFWSGVAGQAAVSLDGRRLAVAEAAAVRIYRHLRLGPVHLLFLEKAVGYSAEEVQSLEWTSANELLIAHSGGREVVQLAA
jgi:hypothetical protein